MTRIVLYAEGITCHSNISIDFLFDKPLGGTEHAVLWWIEVMRSKGYDVSLVMKAADQSISYYFTPEEYLSTHNSADVLICVNFVPGNLVDYKARKKVWWVHQPGLMNVEKSMEEFDVGVALSPYHRGVLERMGWQRRLEVIGYGYDSKFFIGGLKRNDKKLIYCSVPNRGLDLLVSWLPDLIEIDPDIELVLCSSWGIYYDDSKSFPDWGFEIPKDKHIVHVGARGFSELVAWLQLSYIHAYPCTYSDETFCYAALFAQAAGLPVVTTGMGALQNTASGQILISRKFLDDGSYKKVFLDEIDRLLHDKSYWLYYHDRALKKAKKFTWGKIVNQWETLLEDL